MNLLCILIQWNSVSNKNYLWSTHNNIGKCCKQNNEWKSQMQNHLHWLYFPWQLNDVKWFKPIWLQLFQLLCQVLCSQEDNSSAELWFWFFYLCWNSSNALTRKLKWPSKCWYPQQSPALPRIIMEFSKQVYFTSFFNT